MTKYGRRTSSNQLVSTWGVPAVNAGWYATPVTSWTAFSTVTANSSAHTKGAWTELIASTSSAVDCLEISVQGVSSSAVNTATLLDIGTGSAGSETAIVNNVAIGGAAAFITTPGYDYRFSVPVYVPSGTRIAVRIQSIITGGKTAQIAIRLASGPNPSGTSSTTTTLGTSTTTSDGTALPAGTAWTQFVASTTGPYASLSIVPSVSNTVIGTAFRAIELGTGSAASEVTTGRCDFTTSSSEAIGLIAGGLIIKALAAESRLAVRYTTGATAAASFCVVVTETLGT